MENNVFVEGERVIVEGSSEKLGINPEKYICFVSTMGTVAKDSPAEKHIVSVVLDDINGDKNVKVGIWKSEIKRANL